MADDAVQGDDLPTILRSITSIETEGLDPAADIPEDDESFGDLTCGVVRPNHVRGVVRSPDDVVWFEFEALRMFVASKLIGDFALLALGAKRSGGDVITAAYRLYVDDGSAAELAKDARAAFCRFLEQHARPYSPPDGTETLFRPAIRGPLVQDPMEIFPTLLGIEHEGDGNWKALGIVQRQADDTLLLAFPFVLDTDGYVAWVRSHEKAK